MFSLVDLAFPSSSNLIQSDDGTNNMERPKVTEST